MVLCSAPVRSTSKVATLAALPFRHVLLIVTLLALLQPAF